MTASIYRPDDLPPGGRRIIYGVFCWLNRNPVVLRGIGALLRLWPFVGGWFGLAARASAVKKALTRPHSFSNTSHAPNLVAGDYMIGMDPGPAYNADRALLEKRLAGLNVQADADQEARRRVDELQHNAGTPFDLIEDYLMWVVFRAIAPVYGTAADKVAQGVQGNVKDEGLQRQYLLEVRYVAGQLLAGSSATLPIQRRAEVCADALRSRIKDATQDVRQAWNVCCPDDVIERNAVGLAWISHPVTVQSGALVVQELLKRPKAYESLRKRSLEAKPDIWNDSAFRACVRDHILELMRFRPIFPLLVRDVPRDTELETGHSRNAPCAGGTKVSIWSIAALFDSRAVPHSRRFHPDRNWRDEKDMRYLMFGYGTRQCPAKDHAVDILTSALIGLLTLPELRLAGEDGKAIAYDGPLMSRMRVRFGK
jgi:cytochrome P450